MFQMILRIIFRRHKIGKKLGIFFSILFSHRIFSKICKNLVLFTCLLKGSAGPILVKMYYIFLMKNDPYGGIYPTTKYSDPGGSGSLLKRGQVAVRANHFNSEDRQIPQIRM